AETTPTSAVPLHDALPIYADPAGALVHEVAHHEIARPERGAVRRIALDAEHEHTGGHPALDPHALEHAGALLGHLDPDRPARRADRQSTRLNSSDVQTSDA